LAYVPPRCGEIEEFSVLVAERKRLAGVRSFACVRRTSGGFRWLLQLGLNVDSRR